MKSKKPKAGTIVLVPAGRIEYIPAKILYVFNRYPNTLLLKLYSVVVYNDDEDAYEHSLRSEEAAQLMITGTLYVNSGRWPSAGTVKVTPEEDYASLRVEGGQVIYKDEYLREASEADYTSLPRLTFTSITGAELYARELVARLRGE